MKRFLLALACVAGSNAFVLGGGAKEALQDARNRYRQAVAQHGQESREAKKARQNLRAARQDFHNQRRERQHRQAQ